MQIRFWGTRGSIAKAGPQTVRHGGNTSCLEARAEDGTVVVIDCGTGAHGLGQTLAAEGVTRGHVLITHTHWDHIQGIPFFAPFFREGEWHVYGPRGLGQSLQDTLAGQMEYTYFPVTLEQFAAEIDYHDLVEGTIRVGGIRVTARYLNHPALTLGYRLEADGAVVVYASDHEPYARELAAGGVPEPGSEDAKHVAFCRNADLLVHDAQYTAEEYPEKQGWGHSTMEYVVDVARAAGVRRLALHHHDPMRDDDAVDAIVERARERAASPDLEVFAASEGRSFRLNAQTGRRPEARERGAGGRAPRALETHAVLIAAEPSERRTELAEALADDELSVCTADTVEDARAIARESMPSLVMAERDLGGGGALALLRELRGTGSDEDPVFAVLSPDDDPRARESAEGLGADHWLVEPLTLQLLRTKARAWVLRLACQWQPAAQPVDEARRLADLHRLEILDTDPEERFDRYTQIAANLFNVPIALVSLVDRDRQWFKSRQGLDAAETPRDMAFCSHAILRNEIFVVPDALQDPRFADNPLVTGPPHVRFYAGIPLRLACGSAVGTLCLIDHRPRRLNEIERRMLEDLGKLVERELEPRPVASASAGAGI